MKVRMRFTKQGIMRFVGHLDVTRFFQKAFRRSGLSLGYSGGFTPHILLTFASPLPIGMTSEGEYMDLVLAADYTTEDILACLRPQLVEGLDVTDIAILREEAKTPMAILRAAAYRITPGNCGEELFDAMLASARRFMEQQEIPALRQSKKGASVIDIRPLIYDLTAEQGTQPALLLTTAAGSVEHLKPELALSELRAFTEGRGRDPEEEGAAADPLAVRFHRLDLLGADPLIVRPGDPLGDCMPRSLMELDIRTEA